MAKWIDYPLDERKALIANVAAEKNIDQAAAEKDWWVTAVLYAVFQTSIGKYILFKGGTSLSKGWDIISRFSEDVDIALDRSFFLEEKGLICAQCANNTQIHNLREHCQDFLFGEYKKELAKTLNDLGLKSIKVLSENELEDENGNKIKVPHDKDPSVFYIFYPSQYSSGKSYAMPSVKIEISCLSMAEPYEIKQISSLVQQVNAQKYGPHVDDDFIQKIKTVSPARTFLEKAFLLCEEYQKAEPRTEKMSRHLYDLEKLSKTEYMGIALSNYKLYMDIVKHRERFYHVGAVDYTKDYPDAISFIPPKALIKAFRLDYLDMCSSFIYEKDPLSFENLLNNLEKVQNLFRNIKNKA